MAALVTDMRIIVRFSKGEEVRYTSHLDVQRLFQRAFRRAKLPLAYSQGFNPHPLMGFAAALSVGHTSGAEWFDVKLKEYMDTDEFIKRVNAVLPKGFSVLSAMDAGEFSKSLTSLLVAADYDIEIKGETDGLIELISDMLSGEIIVTKRTKGGLKDANIRPDILAHKMCKTEEGVLLTVRGRLNVDGGLNAELFVNAIRAKSGLRLIVNTHRRAMYGNGAFLPNLPEEI